MNKRNYAFGKMNFILLAVGMLIVIVGFLLMTGDASSESVYQPDIFSARRIKLAPAVCFIGFISMIFAILYRSKEGNDEPEAPAKEDEQATKTTKQ